MRKLTVPTLVAAGTALVLAGTAAAERSPLEPAQPAGPNARAIADVYWVVFGVALGLFLLVVLALGFAVVRGHDRALTVPLRRSGAAAAEPGPLSGRRLAFFSAIPLVGMVVVAVAVFAKLDPARSTPQPSGGAGTVKVTATGSQAGWSYDYGEGVTATDELRVPVGAAVRLTVAASDVQVSFWVPRLAGQARVFPGEPRTIGFKADHVGLFDGHSTVPAGVGSGTLGILVEAMPKADYDAWLTRAAAQKAGS